MPSFFGEYTECQFNNDPICDKIGGVSLDDRGYTSESARWTWMVAIGPAVLYVILNFRSFLAWFR